jgi:hypothetical protein
MVEAEDEGLVKINELVVLTLAQGMHLQNSLSRRV